MKAIRILLLLLIWGFSNSFASTTQNILTIENQMAGNLTYSWNVSFEAVSYKIEIEHQTTSEKYSQETANTTATFTNVPNGTYDVIVTAIKADGSTFIAAASSVRLAARRVLPR